MEPSVPLFADEFNVPQKDPVLAFDVLQATVLLPFQVHRYMMLVEAGLIAVSNACFEFADEGPEEARHDSLATLTKVFANPFHGLSKVAGVRICA